MNKINLFLIFINIFIFISICHENKIMKKKNVKYHEIFHKIQSKPLNISDTTKQCIFKKSGEIIVKAYKNNSYEYVINGNYLKYKEKNKSDVKNPLVISIATGYTWERMKIFLISLRNSGYKGKIIIFVKEYNNTIETNFKKYDITPLFADDTYPYYSKRNKEYPISSDELKKCMICDFDYGHKWMLYRHSLFYCFLLKYGHKYSHIFSADVKDIIFQKDPFSWNVDNYLYVVEESSNNLQIKNEFYNYNWIKLFKHYKMVGQCRLLNGGTILGESRLFIEFERRLIIFIEENKKKGIIDQGALESMYYTTDFTDLPIMISRNENGFGITAAIEFAHKNKRIYPHEDNYVYNIDGSKPCFIHQYNRQIDNYLNYIKFHTKE